MDIFLAYQKPSKRAKNYLNDRKSIAEEGNGFGQSERVPRRALGK